MRTTTLRYRKHTCDECGRQTGSVCSITRSDKVGTVTLCHDADRSCYVDTGTASSLRDWDALTEFEEIPPPPPPPPHGRPSTSERGRR